MNPLCDAWRWIGDNASAIEALATVVAAAGAVVLGAATYRVSSHLRTIERDRDALAAAERDHRNRLHVAVTVERNDDDWTVTVDNPPGGRTYRNVLAMLRGTGYVSPGGGSGPTGGIGALSTVDIIRPGTSVGFVFRTPEDAGWFGRHISGWRLAPGVEFLLQDERGQRVGERVGIPRRSDVHD